VGTTFLNLFIAIILDGYFHTVEMEKKVFNEEDLVKYQRVWSDYDNQATGFIEITDLPKLLFQLNAPMGWDSSYEGNFERQQLFIKVLQDSTKTYFNETKLNFADLLENLILVYVI
jgi:hypothetical protein